MKRIVARAHGGPDCLELTDFDAPPLEPGQARIAVQACGVNYIDTYQRSGLYPLPCPVALGLEGAGIVESVGPGESAVAVGSRVCWSSVQGSYATHLVAPCDKLVAIPDAVSFETAAAVMLQGMTAHYLTTSTFVLGPEHTCVVHAASGGVGLLLCQLARARGARVIGIVSTDEKAVLAREAGAHEVLVTRGPPFAARVRELASGKGVSVVYDGNGQATFLESLDCLAPRGMMVSFGNASGPVDPISPALLGTKGSLVLTRPALHHYVATRAELLLRAEDVLSRVARGEIRVRVSETYPLERAADAHRALESRRTTGKLILVPPRT